MLKSYCRPPTVIGATIWRYRVGKPMDEQSTFSFLLRNSSEALERDDLSSRNGGRSSRRRASRLNKSGLLGRATSGTLSRFRVGPIAVIAPVEFADRDVMKCWSRIIPTSY